MPNAYQRRLAARREALQKRLSVEKEEHGVWIDNILRRYEEAYKVLYNETIQLYYRRGWVRVGSVNVRLMELAKMSAVLEARAHEKELNVPEEV